MNSKYFLSFIILGLGITISGFLIAGASAQTVSNIQYPVAELGNCQSETACRTYCDKPENTKACLTFAEKNNLMTSEQLQQAKSFLAAGNKGPGGCTSKDVCEKYCNDTSHMDECVAFAEKNNLMSPQELADAQKVQAAIKNGIKPPACGNKEQCDVYCAEADHMEECINFGMAAGFIQGKELEDAQKMLAAIKQGVKPPPCNGKDACDVYCQKPENMEVCMNFAIAAGFMSDQEKQDSQKMLQALKKGIKPPACNGKEACDAYCAQESHFEECTNFAVAAGFMTPEQADMARKTGGKGPGGCKNKEECDAFCNNPDNQQTCFNFAKDNGLISQEDVKNMQEGKQKFQDSLNQAPKEVIDCLNSSIGADQLEKFKNGTAMPPKDIGDKMQQCFGKAMGTPPNQQGTGGPGTPGQPGQVGQPGQAGQPGTFQAGPGGCKTPEECNAYCQTHQQECQNFQSPSQGPQPQQKMPEGAPMPVGSEGPGGQEMMPGQNPLPGQNILPGQEILPGQNITPPPPGSAPGSESGTTQPSTIQEPMMQPQNIQNIQPPPSGETVPPPPSEEAPSLSPTSVITPQALMGLIFSIVGPVQH